MRRRPGHVTSSRPAAAASADGRGPSAGGEGAEEGRVVTAPSDRSVLLWEEGVEGDGQM